MLLDFVDTKPVTICLSITYFEIKKLGCQCGRKSIRFRRKIVESYRAELVEAPQFQQRLHLSWAKLRRLNRWYYKHRLEPYLHPKCRIKSMKNNAAYLKQLERKLADLEKENQLLRLKAEAYETVIQIAEEQFNIPS